MTDKEAANLESQRAEHRRLRALRAEFHGGVRGAFVMQVRPERVGRRKAASIK